MREVDDRELAEAIAYALWRSYTLRMKSKSLDEARAWSKHVVAHLRLCRIETTKMPMREGHSAGPGWSDPT